MGIMAAKTLIAKRTLVAYIKEVSYRQYADDNRKSPCLPPTIWGMQVDKDPYDVAAKIRQLREGTPTA